MTTIEIVKLESEIDKLRAETRKIVRETGVIPFVAGAGFMAHAAGITCERSHDALTDPRRPDGGTTESTP